MKFKGDEQDFNEERDRELLRIYRRLIADVKHIRSVDICTQISDHPSPRFWVSSDRAAIVVGALSKGDLLVSTHPSKREMYFEIYSRFCELRKKHPKKSVYDLVTEIVYQPAPKFYLTPRTIKEFINRAQKRRRDEKKNRNQ